MVVHILCLDETAAGARSGETRVAVEETCTARDLIRARVEAEVARYEADGALPRFVEPESPEALLQPARRRAPIDVERQVASALRAFEGNGFFLLVGDRQVESLDEPLDLTSGEVSFLKLVPLVGG